jgi:5-methylcytosine-specific restriction enzyme subunit McrC
MYLIYPAHDDFSQPLQQHFAFSDDLKLWVVTYLITAKRGKKIIWPDEELTCI